METDSDTGGSELSHYAYRVSMAADNRSGWDYNDIKGGHETLHRILSTVPEVVRNGTARERSQAVLAGGAQPPGAEAHALWHESVNVAATGQQWDRPDPEVLIHGGNCPNPEVLIHGGDVSKSLTNVSRPGAPPPNALHSRGACVAVFAVLTALGICAGWYATKSAQRARYVTPDTDIGADDDVCGELSIPSKNV
jgi:hypothetical protein